MCTYVILSIYPENRESECMETYYMYDVHISILLCIQPIYTYIHMLHAHCGLFLHTCLQTGF
jgi:hypothetical protein